MQIIQNRRHFLAGLSAAAAAGLVGCRHRLCAEPPPETTTIRLPKFFRLRLPSAPEHSRRISS